MTRVAAQSSASTQGSASRRLWRRLNLPWRPRPESLPIRLGRKRIFILPTLFGVGFGVLLLIMLVGALNYANNAAVLLTCLLAAVTIGSALATFRGLDGLSLEAIQTSTSHAGSPLEMQLHVTVPARPRYALRLNTPDQSVVFSVLDTEQSVALQLATTQRGWLALPLMRLRTTWPFGLFRAWSVVQPAQQALVYPQPEADPPDPDKPSAAHSRPTETARTSSRHGDGDDLAALREYRPGDPRKRVAWKASARHQNLLVREFEAAQPDARWTLAWSQTAGLNYESRIARMAAWVAMARDAGVKWRLQLPQAQLDTGSGDAHYHQCLRALALMP